MFRTKERRGDQVILPSGRPARLESHHGLVHGDRGGLGGTLSVLSWHGEWPGRGWSLCRCHNVYLHSDILGERADIHTGGVDLKFPHHDNEIAQAEVGCGDK